MIPNNFTFIGNQQMNQEGSKLQILMIFIHMMMVGLKHFFNYINLVEKLKKIRNLVKADQFDQIDIDEMKDRFSNDKLVHDITT